MYILKDDLNCFAFHDAHLIALTREGDTLRAELAEAAVLGSGSPCLTRHTPCPLNDGDDRYAAPVLTVLFQKAAVRSILRGGCWKCHADGSREEVYPPRYLEQREFAGLLRSVGAGGGDLVYDLCAEGDTYTISFWLDAGHDYYELTLTAARTEARWESFGAPAWYLERSRHVSG